MNTLNNKVENKKKLGEQLINVILSDKDSVEVKLKKVKYLVRLGANVNQKVNGKSLLKIAREKGYKEIEEAIKESLLKSVEKALDGDNCEIVIKETKDAKREKPIVSKEEVLSLGKQFWGNDGNLKSAKEIEDLIQQGAYVDIENKKGNTALMIASENGYKDVVEVLIQNGASHRTSSLWKAAERGHKEIVEMLLEGGANVNGKSGFGDTALMKASEKGYKEVVEMLLSNGADVNQKNDWGTTALICASIVGHKDVVELLLENGADVNQKDNYGMTALMLASERGRLDVVNILLEGGADVRQKDKYGKTALMRASGPLKNAIIKEIEEHIQKTKPTIGGFLGKIFDGFTR